jgi:hypothetical protein
VSFSRAKYQDVASLVGLDPDVEGTDIPTFEMSYARVPNSILSAIVSDLQSLEAQYGTMEMHLNEETRSRYLAGVGSPNYLRNLAVMGFTTNI